MTKFHVTLHTFVVLRWTHFMLRCTLLLYFADQIFMLCCALLLHFGDQTSCYVAHFCSTMVPKVLAHIDVIDNGWKACKDMLPSSFPSHTPMIMTHDICQSLAYIDMLMPRLGIHRNADVCDNTARRSASWTDGMESLAMSRNASTCRKRNVFWRCSTCIFEFPLR